MRRFLLVGLCALTCPVSVQAQVIHGRVLSSENDIPVPQAGVSAVDSLGNVLRTGLTSASGVFRLELPDDAGPVYLQAQALGFLTYFDGPIPVQAEDAPGLEMRLQPQPYHMDSLTVTVERQSLWLEYTGFYDREALGAGHHIDRDWIVERRPWARTLSDLLRTIPGVSVDNVGGVQLRGMSRIGMTGMAPCPYSVYLDGMLMVSPTLPDDWWARSLIRPEDVDGIEVYRRPSEVPIQYSGGGGCGVILIWSRR